MFAWWMACAEPTDAPDPPTGETGTTGVEPQPELTVPTEPAALEAWLETRAYAGWPAEPGPHASAGPHFGDVRTFLSPELAASLEAGEARHPVGATAVKELYGDGDTVEGYSVMVRVGEAAGDNAWFWYERFGGTTYADDRGVALCSGCHEDGADFILTPWP